ncbi:unnamed protein product [Blepharisma stoltei]|uniref:Uncharacterized protein n=1 Tax=Blepharisma stoltei TaxID=1481888 RepID=A0AAU9IT35_9CILI|nr:unnamed protein product [Blepharisma stoltei]
MKYSQVYFSCNRGAKQVEKNFNIKIKLWIFSNKMHHISSVAQTPTIENTIEDAYIDQNYASSSNKKERFHHFDKASQRYEVGRENKISATENAHLIRSRKISAILPCNDELEQNALQDLPIFTKASVDQNTENLIINLADLRKRNQDKKWIHQQQAQGLKKSDLKTCPQCKKNTYHKSGFCTICKNKNVKTAGRCCVLLSACCCGIMSALS